MDLIVQILSLVWTSVGMQNMVKLLCGDYTETAFLKAHYRFTYIKNYSYSLQTVFKQVYGSSEC